MILHLNEFNIFSNDDWDRYLYYDIQMYLMHLVICFLSYYIEKKQKKEEKKFLKQAYQMFVRPGQ